MSAVAEKLLTEEEYLALEEKSEERHEYVEGVLRLIAGATDEHIYIVQNFILALAPKARKKGCQFLNENKKVKLPVGSKKRYYYPDVVLTCSSQTGPKDILENPCFVAEVLSKSTEHIDKGEKLETYQRIPSLKQYVLVDQTRRKVEAYTRSEDVWIYQMLDAGEFQVACLDIAMRLDEVYAGLEFSEETDNLTAQT
jgi:Uma2 family endonuclease